MTSRPEERVVSETPALPSSNARTLCEAFQSIARECAATVALRTPNGEIEISWTEYGERVQEIINDAERRSMETCEVCGNAGETRKRQAWYSTLCDDCAERQ